MGDEMRVFIFQYLGNDVVVDVDPDKSNLLDIVIEYEDKARENGFQVPRYPDFAYVWKVKQWPLTDDKELMTMFERLVNKKETNVWVGSLHKPSKLNKLVLELRKTQSTNSVLEQKETNVETECTKASNDETGVDVGRMKLPIRRSTRNSKDKGKSVDEQLNNLDRVETHFQKYVVEGFEDKEDDNVNRVEINITQYTDETWAWADIQREMDDEAEEGKSKKAKSKPIAKKKKNQTVLISNEPFDTRRSPRIAGKQSSETEVPPIVNSPEVVIKGKTPIKLSVHKTDLTLYDRKIPRTTAIRKGIVVSCMKAATVKGKGTVVSCSKAPTVIPTEINEAGSNSKRELRVRRRLAMDNTQIHRDASDESERSESDASDDDDYQQQEGNDSSDSDGTVVREKPVHKDELDGETHVLEIEDKWQGGKWYDFFDEDDDDDYFSRLYRSGELYDEKEFGKVELKPWMLFIEKSHFKDVLKDYCVQEGFAITVLWADNFRYTATCAAKCCDWRILASRLQDGRTGAIKSIWPNCHACRGLETYNPICTTKWVASKLMEDIRANPDIKGKELNEILFQRFGLYMRQSTLYKMKNFVINEIFGGHDVSFGLLPSYVKVIHETNPNSTAFCAITDIGHPQRAFQFSSIFISFEAQMIGFKKGCRSLIGVDGAHLKGNFGGILLSAIGLDANNEIFPLAYAVVSVEDKENWSFFFHHLHNLLKDDERDDWTIISDRQKGVDLALKDVWPKAKRRYCCKHLSRNFKKAFPGPLMYILFWRACNASNPFNFKKAMERLRKEGKAPVMKWFAELGKQSRWTKHKFGTSVSCDSNTSNFVESFNSTLGVDRCRPVLTLLEGIRMVCMVRIATRQQNAMEWDDNGICLKIIKIVKDIGQNIKYCKSHMSAPGEFEIHEGSSHFPLSLNKMKCACGSWQLTGIPCRHAIRAIKASKLDPYKYVSPWYSVKKYKATYSCNIAAIPDHEQWPEYDDLPKVLPPPLKRGIGRPSRNRRREEGEEAKGKRMRTVKCTKCSHFGHNMRTCKGGPTAKEIQPTQATVTINKRKKETQTTKANQSKRAKKKQDEISVTGSQPLTSQVDN